MRISLLNKTNEIYTYGKFVLFRRIRIVVMIFDSLLVNLMIAVVVCAIGKHYIDLTEKKGQLLEIKGSRKFQGSTSAKRVSIISTSPFQSLHTTDSNFEGHSRGQSTRSVSFKDNVAEIQPNTIIRLENAISKPELTSSLDINLFLLDHPFLLTEGIIWVNEGYDLTSQLFDKLWEIDDIGYLESLSKSFQEALLRFLSMNNKFCIRQLQKSVSIEETVTPEIFNRIVGGNKVCYYIWPYCEFIKFRNLLEIKHKIFPQNIRKFDFLRLIDYYSDQNSETKPIKRAVDHFAKLLTELIQNYPEIIEDVRNYVAFCIQFVQVLHLQAVEHKKIFTPQKQRTPIRVKRNSAKFSRLIVRSMMKKSNSQLRISKSSRNISGSSQDKKSTEKPNKLGLVIDPNCDDQIEGYQYFIEQLNDIFMK
jgi:hypothetical protein